MDSKFGPDGALYVQVYEGFFTTGTNAGLYRFKYTGGADTPGPDPQWQSTATARQVQFSIGASGGVSYEWDFGDGQTSAGTNPTHTYAERRHLQRQADGDLRRRREGDQDDERAGRRRRRRADDDGPAQRRDAGRHATPLRSRSRCAPPTAPAAPASSGPSTAIDGGAWTRRDNTGNASPFVTEFTVSGEGTTRSSSARATSAGNVETRPGRSRSRSTSPAAAASCSPQSDQFNGSALDPKWQIVNPVAGNPPTVGGGHLTMPMLQGDLYTTTAPRRR